MACQQDASSSGYMKSSSRWARANVGRSPTNSNHAYAKSGDCSRSGLATSARSPAKQGNPSRTGRAISDPCVVNPNQIGSRDVRKQHGRNRRSPAYRSRCKTASTTQKKSPNQDCVVSDSEDGWRYAEIFGAAACESPAKAVDHRTTRRPSGPSVKADLEDNWRWKEILGGEAILIDDDLDDKEDDVKIDDDEDGWRYDEIFATASVNFARKCNEHKVRHIKHADMEDNWRWKEVFSGCSLDTPRPSSSLEPKQVVVEDRKLVDDTVYDVGDIVRLGNGGQPEYSGCFAVVSKVLEHHCTAIVLDDDCRVGVGECWPGYADVALVSCVLRLGTRIVIEGMKGARRKHFNGLTGTITEHPREGHPVFIKKPSSPDVPHLTICITFDDPVIAGERSALLEPRFVRGFDDAALAVARSLGETVTLLTSKAIHSKECKAVLSCE